MAQAITKELRQKKLIDHLRKEDNLMKWGLFAALIVVLLLLLFIGYATDWTAGMKNGSTPLSSTLDSSSRQAGSSTPSTTGTGADTNTTGTTNTGSTGTTNTGSTSNQRTNTGTSSTNDTNRSSTTTNNTTTTNTTTTTPPTVPATPPPGLLSLYADSSIGQPLTSLLSRATSAGISASCTDGLLVTDCVFAVGEYKITTKSLLGTGLLTSVLKNF